jgi:hypothetical protein
LIKEELEWEREKRDFALIEHIKDMARRKDVLNGADLKRYVETYLVHVVRKGVYDKIIKEMRKL